MGNAALHSGNGATAGNRLEFAGLGRAAATDPFTAAFWAYFTVDTFQNFVGHLSSVSGSRPWLVQRNPTGLFQVYYTDGATESGPAAATYSGPACAVGTWYFVVLSYDSATKQFSLYVDDGAATTSPVLTSGPSPLLTPANGVLRTTTNISSFKYLNGKIDALGYWGRILAAAERTWLKNGSAGRAFSELGQAGTDGSNLLTNLLCYYDFEEDSDGTAAVSRADSSGNNRTLTDVARTDTGAFVASSTGIASGGGTNLAAGAFALSSVTPTRATFSFTWAGGVSPFTAYLHRKAYSSDATAPGNQVLSITNAVSPASIPYDAPDRLFRIYVPRVVDSAGSPQTVEGPSRGVALLRPTGKLIIVGDSTSAMSFTGAVDLSNATLTGMPVDTGKALNAMYKGARTFDVDTQAVSGKQTGEYAPAHIDPTTGTAKDDGVRWASTKAAIDAAVAAYGASNTFVSWALGTNNGGGGATATGTLDSSLADAAAFVAYCKSAGVKVLLHDMLWNYGASGGLLVDFALAFADRLDTLRDNTWVYRDPDRDVLRWTATTDSWTSDGTHPVDTATIGTLKAAADYSMIEGQAATTVVGGGAAFVQG